MDEETSKGLIVLVLAAGLLIILGIILFTRLGNMLP